MRKLLLIILLLLVVAACRNNGDGDSSAVEGTSGVEQADSGEDSPRIENTPLPPTATPLPTAASIPEFELPEHVYPASTRAIYVIQPGDTLTKIANQYGVTIDAISDANRHYDFDLIYAGDTLYIPNYEP